MDNDEGRTAGIRAGSGVEALGRAIDLTSQAIDTTAPAAVSRLQVGHDRPVVDLEIVVPAYNEESRLPATLAATVAHLARQPYRSAVVVVDNGSVDLTPDFTAQVSGNRVPVYLLGCSQPGKGAAIRRGMLTGRARWTGFTDADLATPIETLDRVVPLLAAGEPVVVGSRRAPGAHYAVPQSTMRRAGGALFHGLAGQVVRGVHDTQCGFKFFQGHVARRLFAASTVDGFAFDVELLALAQHYGYRISEVPVTWTDRAGSTFNIARHGSRAVIDMVSIAVRLSRSRRDTAGPDSLNAAVAGARKPSRHSHDLLPTLAGTRVLFVNWRDMQHSQAGGAEVYAWELARRFASAGADVCFLTSRPAGASAIQDDDGVRLVRKGGTFSLYAYAAMFLARNRHRFDAVVDCQNGIPFFVPLFARRSSGVVCVIHHVHQEQFLLHFRWPLSWVGRQLESRGARRVYGRRPLVAVSPSTRAGVRRRLGLRGPIFVVPNAVTPPRTEALSLDRSPSPLIVSVGRLVAHKRIDLLVRAARALLPGRPDLRVEIAGDGPDRARLESLTAELDVGHAVRFHGRVSEQEKAALLSRAWLTVNPSLGEGWGIGIIEGNSYGTPAVAYRVPGLRDSIRHGVTGWLVDEDADFVAAIGHALDELSEPDVAEQWARRCRAWADRFSWDESARRLAGVVVAELTSRRQVEVRYRRDPHRSDINCVVGIDVADADAFAEVATARLRPTDLWTVQGQRAEVLLYGADEDDACGVLQRLGVSGMANVRVATSYDLLVGPGWTAEDQHLAHHLANVR